jgi:hypothetical protein
MKTLPPEQNPNANTLVTPTLFEVIQIELHKTGIFHENSSLIINDAIELLKKMGYNNTKKGLSTLKKFLACGDTFNWLQSGHYDFHYNSEEFLKKITGALKINPDLFNTEMNRCNALKNEHRKIKGCYIFVNTHFKRAGQPIFALAFMESERRIALAKADLMFKTDKQIFNHISNLVKKHYQETHGQLKMWGNIDNYLYHHFDGKTYAFDNNGYQLDSSDGINESRATLSIK